MKPLILKGWSGPSLLPDLADLVINFTFRFVSGALPSPDKLATYVAARSEAHGRGTHWSDFAGHWPKAAKARKHLALAEFCQSYEIIELWFDSSPNDQLQLIWLLNCLSPHPEIAAKLRLRLVDFDMNSVDYRGLGRWAALGIFVDVTAVELETASKSWQAYRAATPEGCFGLLRRDLNALPLLRPALHDLLEELPWRTTGLGATEMRLLELIARGYSLTNALFYLRSLRRTRVFGEFEIGYLLDGLAHGPRPAVAGLDDELRTLERENLGGRNKAYKRSRLSLTEFGKAVLAHKEDFSRHNPIDRWWGGTHLTNDRLWRCDPVLIAP
jgi:hypothetical protein